MMPAVARIGVGLSWFVYLISPSTDSPTYDRACDDLALSGLWDPEQQHIGQVRGLWPFRFVVTESSPEGAGGESGAAGSDA